MSSVTVSAALKKASSLLRPGTLVKSLDVIGDCECRIKESFVALTARDSSKESRRHQ